MYYRGSLGALLIFDLTSYESFEHLPQWIEEVKANVKAEVPLLLVGNKHDLVDERAVSLEEINDFTSKFNLYYMETSAKTGEGVNDCFYVLACLMVGAMVPSQFISQGIVYNPGQVFAVASSTSAEIIPLAKSKESPYSPIIPEPEIEFTAPSTAKPSSEKIIKPISPVEQKIPIPEPRNEEFIEQPTKELEEIEFKTQKGILTESPETSAASEGPVFRPKSVPFSSNIPVPAPIPKEFKTTKKIEISESIPEITTPIFETKGDETHIPSESESLVEYMPKTILSKKERKKLEKQKRKEEKERKLQEKKAKAVKLKEEMQKVKKGKKEKQKKEKKEKFEKIEITQSPPLQAKTSKDLETKTPTFFQTLSQKTEESAEPMGDKFVPFISTRESEPQETSKISFIPNIADIDSETGINSGLPFISTIQDQEKQVKKKELIVCKQCGATLSSDYMFCNKCGSKL